MADISKVTLPNNETYDLKDSVARGGIGNAKLFYGTCSSAAATTEKAVTCSEFTANDLVAGTMINVKFDATNSGAVASLTLNVNGTGAKSIKYIYNNERNNIPAAGYLLKDNMYTFRYDGTYWVAQLMYNTNTTTGYGYYDYYFRACAGTSAIYRYKIVGMGEDNRLYPIVTTNQTSATQVAKAVQTTGIRPGHLWIYYSTTTASAGGAIAAATLLAGGGANTVGAYSFNESIPTYRTIYLRGTYDREKDLFYLYDDGTTPCKSYYTFIPTNSAVTLSDYFVEGNYYMIVGGSYSSENYFSIFADNPLYYFDGTNLIPVSTKVAKDEITSMVGTDEQEDNDPYSFRKTANGKISGSTVAAYDEIVGGSIVWNQLMKTSGSGGIRETRAVDGITFTNNGDGSLTLNGTATKATSININNPITYPYNHTFFIYNSGFSNRGSNTDYITTIGQRIDNGGGGIHRNGTTYNTSILRLEIANGSTYNNVKIYPIVIDLTAAVTPLIADYIYTLETANAGDGVAWFKKYFPGVYYGFAEPHFEHVRVSAKNTVGFNALDIDTYLSTGFSLSETKLTNVKTDTRTSFQPTIQLFKNGSFVATLASNSYSATGRFSRVFNTGDYDADSVFVKHNGSTQDFYVAIFPYNQLLKNTDYCWSVTVEKNNPTVVGGLVLDEICINIHGDRDGEYEPYCKHIYPIEPKVLRGVPKLDSANRLYFNGDIYRHDGSGEQRYLEVDLGSLNWTVYSADRRIYRATVANLKTVPASQIANIVTPKYKTVSGSANWQNGDIATTSSSPDYIFICDNDYADAASFKTAMSGQILVYEANTPEPFTAEPFQSPMVVDPLGTEEFVDYAVEQGDRDVAIPVGHNTIYRSGVYGEVGLKADTSYVNESIGDDILEKNTTPYNRRLTADGKIEYDISSVNHKLVGGTIAWNQLLPKTTLSSGSSNGITVTADSSTGEITITGTATATSEVNFYSNDYVRYPAGHVMYFPQPSDASDSTYWIRSGGGLSWSRKSEIMKPSEGAMTGLNLRVRYVNGATINAKYKPQLFDLTSALTSDIAEHIYNLEQITAGLGVAWFKKYFPNEYFAANSGELMSVNTSKAISIGFNQWDEEWRNGYYSAAGSFISHSNYLANKNMIPVLPSTTYYVKCPARITVLGYDNNGKYISRINENVKNSTFTTTENTGFICFSSYNSGEITTYNNDICINLYKNDLHDGEYESYKGKIYPLDGNIILRGYPLLDDSGNLHYDGDIRESDGTIRRKYGEVDLGTYTWVYDGDNMFRTAGTGMKLAGRMICAKYKCVQKVVWSQIEDGEMSVTNSQATPLLRIHDSKAGTDATAFKAAMSGVMLVYEREKEIKEVSTPFNPHMFADKNGSEFFIDNGVEQGTRDVSIPVGHISEYGYGSYGKTNELIGEVYSEMEKSFSDVGDSVDGKMALTGEIDIPNGTSLNTIFTPGTYYSDPNNDAATITDTPLSPMPAFRMYVGIVTGGASKYTYQRVFTWSDGVEYYRYNSTNTDTTKWSAWSSDRTLINGKVSKSGDTMTGKLVLQSGQYTDNYTTGALDLRNSNIQGVNSIYTADASDNSTEGIHFYRDASHVDTIHASSGTLYFTPNRQLGTAGTSKRVIVDGSTFPEAYLSWGGRNFAASYAPIDAAMVDYLGANRFAFLKAAGITVEYTRDNGETWIDYGLTDAQKVGLFSTTYACVVGKSSNTDANRANANCQLRVTIDTNLAKCYTVLNKFIIYVSTTGSGGCWASLDVATHGNPTTWVNRFNKIEISGWSGYNVINTGGITTYGNSDSHYQYLRFTFGITTQSSNYVGLSVSKIMAYGGVGWTTASNMATHGHLYSFDSSQNATFPAKVTATEFSGAVATSNISDRINQTIKGGDLGWTSSTDGDKVVTLNTLAYWGGQYKSGSSNLEYCSKGKFGNLAIKDSLTASEVGAVPTTRKVNNKELSADVTLTASDVGAAKAESVATTTLAVASWSNGVYSFTSTYPNASYDIAVEPDGNSITAAQYEAWTNAKIVGNSASNTIKALGTVPTVAIPVVIRVMPK